MYEYTSGATHEQNRHDRDLFVKINHENILEKDKDNFEKKTEGFNARGTPYDYQSIMHYTVCADIGKPPMIIWNMHLGPHTHPDYSHNLFSFLDSEKSRE